MGKWLAILLLLISIVSTQVGASVAKGLFPILEPEGVCFLRVLVATVILMVIWRPWRFKPTAKQIRTIAAYGISLGVMNLTYYLALQKLQLGLTVALEFIGPLGVALFFSRRRLDFLWAFMAIIGLLFIVPAPGGYGFNNARLEGIALALTAGAAWAFYIVFGKRASGAAHSGVATSIGMTAALVTVAPFSVPDLSIGVLQDPRICALALAVGVLSSALPYSLEMVSLRHLPAKSFGILLSLSPAIAALSGFFILHESLSKEQIVAIAFILMASLGSAIWAKPEAPPPVEI